MLEERIEGKWIAVIYR